MSVLLVVLPLVLAALVLPRRDGTGQPSRTGPVGRRWGAVPARPRGRARRRDAAEDELLAVLEALEPALRAGLPVRSALAGPVAATPLGAALLAADTAGAPLADVWSAWAHDARSPAGELVHRAWRLGERLGSPLADAVRDAAQEVRATAERRRRLATAVAGPRATARLLTVLPVAGPALALALGLRPEELWGGAGGVAAAVGAVLVVVGHLWCGVLLRSVTRPRALVR